jgi:elongation factor Tu
MSDIDFDPAQAQAALWIIGHAGHGKTTLTAAITRCLSKNSLTQAWRCVKIDGASVCPPNTKAAILVVSAADGPMPQTRDHLRLAKQAGIARVAVFLNKMDAADKALVELIEMEMRDLLTMCGFAGDKAAVIRGSAARALEGDESDIGEPSIERLLNGLGKDGPAVASKPGATSGGGLGGLFRRLFS